MKKAIVKRFTTVTSLHGMKLHLIDKLNPLYSCPEESLPEELPKNPWWAFAWPGGSMLTKFIFENPHMFRDKIVFDIGSGCGSASIASLMSGAKKVIANDVDEFAGVALELNMQLNGVDSSRIEFDIENNIGAPSEFFHKFDIILCGDMLYDPEHAEKLLYTLQTHEMVLFGDPGRTYCPTTIGSDALLASYPFEEDGFNTVKIFKLC